MNVVFLSPHFPPNFWQFCRGLREAGATPLGIGDAPWEFLRPELRGALAEYYWVPDLHRYDDVLRGLAYFTFRHGKIERLDSMSEHWLEIEARLRDDFNVPGLRAADMPRVKRKSVMKEVFAAAGVRAARGRICATPEDLRALASAVGYPLVAKPDVGVGAAQTWKIEDAAGLERFAASKPAVDYMVEEFVDAPIVTYDGLVDREGRVVFEASLHYGRGVMEVVNEDGEMWYTAVRDIPADLAAAGRALVDAFGVRERFFHFEFFRLADGGLVGLEVNVRPPGGLTVDMWNYQSDVDMYREWGNLLMRGHIQATATRPYHVTWAGRKDRFRYAWSAEEIRARYGPMLVLHERVHDVFAGAIGNEGFVLRAPEMGPLLEAVATIREKA